jgi:hypothetical protein
MAGGGLLQCVEAIDCVAAVVTLRTKHTRHPRPCDDSRVAIGVDEED